MEDCSIGRFGVFADGGTMEKPKYTPWERERALEHLARQFMMPEILRDAMWEVDTEDGRELVPVDLVGDEDSHDVGRPTVEALRPYCEAEPREDEDEPNGVSGIALAERIEGWFARLSASGYMDRTDWNGPYETRTEAEDALIDAYVDPDDWDVISKKGEEEA
jgi:hypothetical protein